MTYHMLIKFNLFIDNYIPDYVIFCNIAKINKRIIL